MRRDGKISRVESLRYHDIVFIRLFHLDGYGVVDSVNPETNTITFSKLLTAKKDTKEWQRDVAENITLQFDREQMGLFGVRDFMDRIAGTRCPLKIGDFLTPGDYICPDVSAENYLRFRDGMQDYLVMVRINQISRLERIPMNFFNNPFRLADPVVLFDTAIKVDTMTKDLLGMFEPGVNASTGQPRTTYSLSNNCLQIKGEKFDVGGYKEVQDYLIQGVLL